MLRAHAFLLAALGGAMGCAGASSSLRDAARPSVRSYDRASLRVTEPMGALVYVDDEAVGLAPVAVELEPGEHEVAVAAAGHRTQRRMVTSSGGEELTVAVDLEATPQRVASFVLLGAGAAALTAGVVLGALAQAERGGVGMWQPDGAQDLTLGAGLSGGLGALLVVTGGALFVLDVPALPDAPSVSLGPTGVTARF